MEILFPLFLFPFPLSLKSNSFLQPISSIGPVATGVAQQRQECSNTRTPTEVSHWYPGNVLELVTRPRGLIPTHTGSCYAGDAKGHAGLRATPQRVDSHAYRKLLRPGIEGSPRD